MKSDIPKLLTCERQNFPDGVFNTDGMTPGMSIRIRIHAPRQDCPIEELSDSGGSVGFGKHTPDRLVGPTVLVGRTHTIDTPSLLLSLIHI